MIVRRFRTPALACLWAAMLAACSRGSERPARVEAATTRTEATTTSARADSAGALPTAAIPAVTSGFEYYTAAALDHVADSLAHTSSTGHRLGTHGAFQYLVIRRPRSGVVEVHDRWADVTYVQAGRGTLVSGGRVNGSHAEPDGEHRGGTIEGGSSRPVAAGDLMIIPAGIPHQYLIAPGDSLRYLTTKVLQPAGLH